MALSNTAVPRYYGEFRDAVLRGEIPICREIEMEMYRIDSLIDDPKYYYDDQAVEGFIAYCETELTLTDGSDLKLLDTFKLWAEEIFGWYYFEERTVYRPDPDGHGGHYVRKRVKRRLTTKQYLIVARGAAKSMYASCLQSYFLNVDTSTTHQITVAPTMKQAEEVMSPKLPTNILAIIVSIVLTLVAFFAYCQIKAIAVVWYMVAAAVVLGFMVAYAAMFGFDKLKEALAQIGK